MSKSKVSQRGSKEVLNQPMKLSCNLRRRRRSRRQWQSWTMVRLTAIMLRSKSHFAQAFKKLNRILNKRKKRTRASIDRVARRIEQRRRDERRRFRERDRHAKVLHDKRRRLRAKGRSDRRRRSSSDSSSSRRSYSSSSSSRSRRSSSNSSHSSSSISGSRKSSLSSRSGRRK